MKNRKPAWWQLLLLIPAMLSLGALEHLDPVPGVSETIVDAGIIILTFAGMLAWVHVNEGIIEHYEVDKEGWLRGARVSVYPPSSKDTAGQERTFEDARPTVESSIGTGRPALQVRGGKNKWPLN